MAYAHNFWRVSFGGPHFVTEEWSCNICIGAPGGSTDGNPDGAELTAIYTAINTWFVAGTSINNPQSKLEYVKANEVGTNGLYVNPSAVVEHHFATPASGAASAPAEPQNSCVISWMTARTRGPGAHGRIYPPTGNCTIGSDGMISTAITGPMATNAKTLLDALNDVHAGFQVIVASQGGQAGTPANVPVTHVRVGRLMDNQQRRRNRLLENYSAPLALESV